MGSYHRFAYGVQIADKVKQGYFYDFSAKRSLNHHYRDHDKSGFSYVNLKGGIDNRYGQYALYYDVFNHAGQFPGALTGGEIDINRQMVAPGSENSFVHARTQSLTFTAKKILKNSFIVRTHGRLSSETMTGNLISDFSKRRNARLISPSLEWLPERGGKFITGIEYADDAYQYANKSAYAQDAHDKRKNASLYAISRVPLKEQWSFGLGARGAKIYDQLNESSSVGGVIVTEQALYFNPTNAMSFYLKRAGNYRFPKVDEQNNQEAPPAPLKTQRGISYEVGGRYTESRYRLQADLYQLNIKNEIAYAPAAPGENNATNRNLDPTRRTGILFSARIALSKTLCSDVNFSYVHARYMRGTFEGNELPFVSSMLGRLAVTKAINEHWSVLGESLFTGRRYAAEDDANGGGQLGSFTVYNAAVSFKYQQVAASLRVNNISNKRYYNYVLLPAGFENVHYPAAERNVVFQVSYDFV